MRKDILTKKLDRLTSKKNDLKTRAAASEDVIGSPSAINVPPPYQSIAYRNRKWEPETPDSVSVWPFALIKHSLKNEL